MNHTRYERMKCLSKALAVAARKADKAINEAAAKQAGSENASTGHDERRMDKESDIAMGAALAALDECVGLSSAAIDASRS